VTSGVSPKLDNRTMDVTDTPSRSRLLWSELKVDYDLGCGVRRDANLSLSGVCTVIFIGNAKNARFNPITVVPVLSTVPYWTPPSPPPGPHCQ
jgi:hypothetical protein